MPGKKSNEKQEDVKESKLRHLLKKELARWYCSAMYSGKFKPDKSQRSSCSARKA